jgi:hypothetical protein
MPPWDAVKVVQVMTGKQSDSGKVEREGDSVREGEEERTVDKGEGHGVVALAMHWGTFVPDPADVLRTLGALEWACKQQGVVFARGFGEGETDDRAPRERPVFVAVNHGGSVLI